MREGILAEFESPEALVGAHDALARDGYERLTSFTPYAVPGIVGRSLPRVVPWIMLAAAIVGGTFGYLVQWWCNAVNYPIDVGGRPYHSVPAFIPITFESAVLVSSLTGFVALLWVCGLPRLSHPVFEVEGFESATVDRFWLGVDAEDPKFDPAVAERLKSLGALRCARVGGPP